MAPRKENLSESVSVVTQRQLDKFVRHYRIPTDFYPVLQAKDKTIYPFFFPGKFPLYTRVCNFANYRVPFSRFLIKVLRFFRVHLCQVNPFGLSRVNHFEVSCRALNWKPDLNVFRYFYEFITAGDWYTFAHRKGIPSPAGDEKSSLKNWKDNFFWLDDRCLPAKMVWRFKDQSMIFELGEDFVFDQRLGQDLIDNRSPIRPFSEHLLLLGRVCYVWGRGDRGWPVIRKKGEREEMSLRDALRVPNFNTLDFDFDELAEDEKPFLRQVSVSAQEIRHMVESKSSEAPAVENVSTGPKSNEEAAGSSGAQVRDEPLLVDDDSDPVVRNLDEALMYPPSGVSTKGKGVSLDAGLKGLVWKRKADVPQIRSSISLRMPKVAKKTKKSSSHSGDNVLDDLNEHLSGGKSSREEAAKARFAPSATFSAGGDEQGRGKVQGDVKMVTFSGTILGSSLGPDCFLDDEEDQVSSLPSSWFGPEVMAFFRYAYVFSDEMEIDPATTEEKFVPNWDVKNKDSVMDELTTKMYLFNINAPLDHSRSRRRKSQDVGVVVEAESVKEDLEKEISSLKRKMQRTPDAEKKLAQLSLDLAAQKEKIKSLTALNQSSQAAAASTSEERDKVAAELKSFVASSKEKDEEHRGMLAKMEETLTHARAAYEKMLAAGRS
ncbi:hypothetical protein Hdeb2414_s0003g00087861 [Helianthus debilis subsp. tardiflorus]